MVSYKKILTLFILLLTPMLGSADEVSPSPQTALSFTVKTIEGVQTSLSMYKGKVLLIVNTASKCGFTPQYHDLQELFETYKEKDFVVLGFPSNDFNEQEPGSNQEIKHFCTSKFGVKFPLFEKGVVTGSDKQPLFKYLTEEGGSDLKGEIEWNFEKFIVDKSGVVKARFGSFVNPQSSIIKKKIEELLK